MYRKNDPMKAIEIETLTKRYGSARGVEDLSFDIEEGEIFGYLGPNGSGKTTTIRCMMGLLRPTSGQCRILGERIVHGKATQHRRIGYLPGEFRAWPGLTPRKLLRLLARLGQWRGRPGLASRRPLADGRDQGQDALATDRRQEELAERLDLNLDRKMRALSKGNRQKVGIIYAFQHQPDVLILDEPTIGLDPLIRQTVLDLIRETAQAGATVLLSSHDLSEVAAVCARAAILREGRLVELAPISRIVQQGQRRIKVWFIEGTHVPTPPADQLPGVRVIQQNSNTLHVAYQGTVDALLKWLAQFPVDRVTTPETSLEDAFIHYYRKEGNHES